MIVCQDATPSAVANQLFGEMILANLIRAAENDMAEWQIL